MSSAYDLASAWRGVEPALANVWRTSTDPSWMLAALGDQADERRLLAFQQACRDKFRTSSPSTTRPMGRPLSVQEARMWAENNAVRGDYRCNLIRCLWPPPMMGRERVECGNCNGLGSIEAMDSICQLVECKKCNGTGDAPLINPRWRTPLVTDLAGKARGGESKHTIAGGGDYRYAPNTELMPILADALMDQGCDNEIITDHLRHPHHVPGECWVVGMLLGTARESTIISSR